MKKQVYEINADGFITDRFIVEFDDETGEPLDELADNIVTDVLPDGFYRARRVNNAWIEDMSQDDIDALNSIVTPPTLEERQTASEAAIMALMEAMM